MKKTNSKTLKKSIKMKDKTPLRVLNEIMMIELDLRNSRQSQIEVMKNLTKMKRVTKRKYAISAQPIKQSMISNQFAQDKARYFLRDRVFFR